MTSRAREISRRIGQKGDLEPKLEKRVLKTRFSTLDPPSLILIRGGACRSCGSVSQYRPPPCFREAPFRELPLLPDTAGNLRVE